MFYDLQIFIFDFQPKTPIYSSTIAFSCFVLGRSARGGLILKIKVAGSLGSCGPHFVRYDRAILAVRGKLVLIVAQKDDLRLTRSMQ